MAVGAGGIRVNGERLWSRLREMASIGATAHGGCNRQALTDLDLQGRGLLSQWGIAAGCSVRVDAIGNLFIHRPGRDDTLPVVLAGSHLDTQPTGGRFDGVYGVLAALEVIDTLNDQRIETDHPLEIAVWCNEEGCRFPIAMMGSAVWASRLPLEQAHALLDRDGISVGAELARAGIRTDTPIHRQAVKAALEVHIEQGPVLEQQARTIGVVTGVQHMCRYEVLIQGQEAHAGPTPMHRRRDPVRALSAILPRLYQSAYAQGPDARLTVGIIETQPGSPNTVPGRLRLTVDLRHPDAGRYQSLCAEAERIVAETLAAEGLGLSGEMRRVWEAPGVSFDADCVAAVRTAAQALDYPSMTIVSGAGHDSCNTSYVVPTAMIFVPCAGGLSHNEAESAEPADLAAGANVLLHAMLSLAGCD
jgi:N-carbamoyl-L-amino-acid hydrolase